ncbi:archease [Amycolatopsis benzoatilytica]|uniref:archease n=1 Tax=Amycolatopsis benzoatilytica TaxID=346045 RepID=UPI000364502D|nr:archease [Amycolatopsis benzoatilytica]
MTGSGEGHRTVEHTADLRIEAWAPTREQCIGHAVAAMVESLLGSRLPAATSAVECVIARDTDADLLAGALDEVIFLLDTTGRVPVATEVWATTAGLRLRLHTVDVSGLVAVGAVPKAVSLHELRCERRGAQWWSTATIDV